MFVYKNFDYVNYILNLPAEDGLLLYYKCIERINDEVRKTDDNRLWQAYIQNGQEGQTFDDYKTAIGYYTPTKERKKSKNQMTNDEKIMEEQRIKNNVVDIRRIIEEKDKKNQVVEGGKH